MSEYPQWIPRVAQDLLPFEAAASEAVFTEACCLWRSVMVGGNCSDAGWMNYGASGGCNYARDCQGDFVSLRNGQDF